MSDTFDPGPGWREVNGVYPQAQEYLRHHAPGGRTTYWVREEPVPPLPSEPYTVIQVTWADGDTSSANVYWLLDGADQWANKNGDWVNAKSLQDDITGFEVLAEPLHNGQTRSELIERVRRETEKAVLDRVIALMRKKGYGVWHFTEVAREFGVEP